MRIGLATIQYGRRPHLDRQALAVNRLDGLERYVVVSMEREPPVIDGAEVVHLPAADRRALPLAAARNAAIEQCAGLDLVVMLDVDCIPDPGIIDAYRSALRTIGSRRVLLAGSVAHLDRLPGGRSELDDQDRRRARLEVRRPRPAGLCRQPRFELFWSLSYAVCPEVHRRIGGFDERYVGYGAEDTDYAFRARERGAELWEVPDAWAYHQPHRAAREDPDAIATIVANVNRFQQTWGTQPMPDWVQRCVDRGQLHRNPDGTLALGERSGSGSVAGGAPNPSGGSSR